jgi:predicted dehydrogenase
MIKIGVLGAGHLGKIHIKLLKEIPEFDLIGFYDPDSGKAAKIAEEFGIKQFDSIDALIENSEAVDIVTPTLSHFDCAQKALRQCKHIFVEKPLVNSVDEGKKLLKLVEEANVKAQVGHVERFNPAFLEASKYGLKPIFIEAHRLSQFNPRGTDVSVVMDLMIHDIDIILSMVKSEVKHLHASGVAIISDRPDIVNARIEFNNGTVANLTASRISQKNKYITIDFADKKVDVFSIDKPEMVADNALAMMIDPGNGKEKKAITYERPEVTDVNAIKMELEEFASSIINNTATAVSVEEGYASLKLAHQIHEKIEAQFVH